MDYFPAAAQTLEADGEKEQLLKGQTPPGQGQGLLVFGEVDVLIGVVDAAEMVGLADLVGQGVGEDAGARVQPLADGPGENQLADPGGQGIDGHDPAGELPAADGFHHRRRHAAAQEVSLRPAVEEVRLSLVKLVFQPGLVEEGDLQHAGVVHGPDLDQVHSLADVGKGGRRGDHGGHTGGGIRVQLGDGDDLGAVLIAPGEPADEIPQGGNAQLFQSLGPLGTDAVDELDTGFEICHTAASFPLGWHHYTHFCRT